MVTAKQAAIHDEILTLPMVTTAMIAMADRIIPMEKGRVVRDARQRREETPSKEGRSMLAAKRTCATAQRGMQACLFRRLFSIVWFALFPAISAASESVPTSTEKVVVVGTRDPAWMSYREAYRVMQTFEESTLPKDLIKVSYQVYTSTPDSFARPLTLMLEGPATHLQLELDPMGRAHIPLLADAYAEGAEFMLNRPPGTYQFRYLVQLKIARHYDYATLKTACKQVLDMYYRLGKPLDRLKMVGKSCTGTRFMFSTAPALGAVQVVTQQGSQALLVQRRSVLFRFNDWPAHAVVQTQTLPLAVEILME